MSRQQRGGNGVYWLGERGEIGRNRSVASRRGRGERRVCSSHGYSDFQALTRQTWYGFRQKMVVIRALVLTAKTAGWEWTLTCLHFHHIVLRR